MRVQKNAKKDSNKNQLGTFIFNIRDKVDELIQRHEIICEKKEDFILLNNNDSKKEINGHDIININVGGSIFKVRRDTLTFIQGSRLEVLFSGNLENKILRDDSDHVFFDVDPYYFEKVLDHIFICKLLHEEGENNDDAIQKVAPKLEPDEEKVFRIYWSYFAEETQTEELEKESTSKKCASSIDGTNVEILLDTLVKNLEEKLYHMENMNSTGEEAFVSCFIANNNSINTTLGDSTVMNLHLSNGEKLQVKMSTLCQFEDSKFTKSFLDDEWMKEHTIIVDDNLHILIEQPASMFKTIVNQLRLKALSSSNQEIPMISIPLKYNGIFEKVLQHQFPNSSSNFLKKNKLIASEIITTKDDENQIVAWLDSVAKAEKPKLLYRASKHGWKTIDFHKECDGKGETLTVIKTKQGYIFGGYTNCPWKSNKNIFQSSAESFLFSLKCYAGLGPTKMNIKSGQESYATYSNALRGPAFGGGHEICIGCTNDDLREGYTYYRNMYYELPKNVSENFLTGKTGSTNLFGIEEVEVFQV